MTSCQFNMLVVDFYVSVFLFWLVLVFQKDKYFSYIKYKVLEPKILSSFINSTRPCIHRGSPPS